MQSSIQDSAASRSRAYVLLAILLLLWSANFIFVKMAVRDVPSGLVVALRYLFAGVGILPVYAIARRAQSATLTAWRWRDAPALLTVGLLGLVGNQVLFVFSLSLTSVAHGAIISSASPILVLLGSALMRQEVITRRKVGGMLVAAAGIAALQLGRSPAGAATIAGDLLMLLSAIVFAAFNVFGKPVATRFGSLTLNVFGYVAAGLLAAPVVLGSGTSFWRQTSVSAWAGIAYMAIFTSILGYLIYAWALCHLPASRVSAVVYLLPILAALLALLALGENPGPAFLPAAALVLGGVYVVEHGG